MAISVASFNGDLLVRDWPKQGIQRQNGSVESRLSKHGLKSRITALVGYWETLKDCNSTRRSISRWNRSDLSVTCDKDGNTRDLFKPCGTVRPEAVPPPTYEESIQDLPPDYTTTELLATVQTTRNVIDSKIDIVDNHRFRFGDNGSFEKINFADVEGIRSHAGKKAKKAAKAAQQAKWADSDNEENKDEGNGAGGDENGGGDGDAGAGGDGGDHPGGGDGGDDDDWWNAGTCIFEYATFSIRCPWNSQ